MQENLYVAMSVTGIAGPDGGTKAKPVGTVWFAWLVDEMMYSNCQCFTGDRLTVREQAIRYALDGMICCLQPQDKAFMTE